MDFVERIFHISPDHGSGLTEIAIFAVLVAIPLLFAALRNRSRRACAGPSELGKITPLKS
jgi:hypothetical protein